MEARERDPFLQITRKKSKCHELCKIWTLGLQSLREAEVTSHWITQERIHREGGVRFGSGKGVGLGWTEMLVLKLEKTATWRGIPQTKAECLGITER